MSRVLLPIGIVAVCALALIGTLSYFAYGASPQRSGSLQLDGLQQPSAIQWDENGQITIEAASTLDLLSSLGYAHAADHAWMMTLLRQAANGELADWFGADYIALDRHARMLGLGQMAQRTYSSMPQAEREFLVAYANGANLALTRNEVAQTDEFVLLDINPEPWQPWDALAIERLLAWIGTPALVSDSSIQSIADADSALTRFRLADASYRDFLRLGGFDQSRAWSTTRDGSTSVNHQIVYGSTALPIIQEITLRRGSSGTLVGTIPGTLAFPFGQNDNLQWSIFLTSSASLSTTELPAPPSQFDRLVDRDGNETLLTFPRSSTGLYFKAEPPLPPPSDNPDAIILPGDSLVLPPPDSLNGRPESPASLENKNPPAWLISWSGFSPSSDLSAWLSLLGSTSEQPVFTLFNGNGLLFEQNGETSILGSPAVVRQTDTDTFASESAGGEHVHVPPDSIVVGLMYSAWAADIAPNAISSLGHRDSLAAELKDPYAFLKGWSFEYKPESIAASIFDLWMVQFHASTQQFPSFPLDSTQQVVLASSLRKAVDELNATRGSEPSNWRWSYVQSAPRSFPVWSDSVQSSIPRRYEPILEGPGGHPTSFLSGPAHSFENAASASWSTSTSTSDWATTHIKHLRIRTHGFLARDRSAEDRLVRTVRRDVPMNRPLFLQPRD